MPELTIDEVRSRWDEMAQSFTELQSQQLTIQAARHLHAHMDLNHAKNVLEIAAGGGVGSEDILQYLNKDTGVSKELYVTDLAPAMVELAHQRLKPLESANVTIHTEEANGQDLSQFQDDTFDRYIASMCLQLTPNPDAMLREARRVLAPEGVAGFTIWGTPEHSGIFMIDAAVKKELGTGDGSHHPNFNFSKDLDALRRRFAAAGFSTVRVWQFQSVLELWCGEEYAKKHDAFFAMEDEEKRQSRFSMVKRMADDWLAKGYPIGQEAYIVLAKA